jgi:hypothetical protein
MTSAKRALICTITDLKARCIVDQATHCWNWQGAMVSPGMPGIYAFDHATGDKHTMTGTKAAWNIAHGRAPLKGWLVARCCGGRLCLNPAHLREFRNRAELGQHIRRSGRLIGNSTEQRRASIRLAYAAQGMVETPAAIVLAIRAAPAGVTSTALAAVHGLGLSTICRIRRGASHRMVGAVAERPSA